MCTVLLTRQEERQVGAGSHKIVHSGDLPRGSVITLSGRVSGVRRCSRPCEQKPGEEAWAPVPKCVLRMTADSMSALGHHESCWCVRLNGVSMRVRGCGCEVGIWVGLQRH